ncbi:MAG: hypothetical protein ACQESF_02410 [Nanobdellota archaeon]
MALEDKVVDTSNIDSWKVTLLTGSTQYIGTLKANGNADKRTVSLLNKPPKKAYVFNPTDVVAPGFIELDDVTIKTGSTQENAKNLKIKIDDIILAYDYFEEMGNNTLRKQAKNLDKYKTMSKTMQIYTSRTGNSMYSLKGKVNNFQNQYTSENKFIPIKDIEFTNILGKDRLTREINFLALNKNYIESYSFLD